MKRNVFLVTSFLAVLFVAASCGEEKKQESVNDSAYNATAEVKKQEQAVVNDSGKVDPSKLEEMMKDAPQQ